LHGRMRKVYSGVVPILFKEDANRPPPSASAIQGSVRRGSRMRTSFTRHLTSIRVSPVRVRGSTNEYLAVRSRAGRARILHSFPIGFGQRHASQTHSDFRLVAGMNVKRLADVDRARKPGIRELEHSSLGFAQLGPFAVHGCFAHRSEIGQLDDVEREVTLSPGSPLSPDKGGQQSPILVCPAGIALTLVPERSADGVGHDRAQHGVV